MNNPPTFTVANWSEQFENCASRKLRSLNWVPIPNGHDSLAYCRLIKRKDGPEVFTAWILLVQLASRCATRGVLASSDGRPYGPEDMAVKTRAPERLFFNALPELVALGWVEQDGKTGESAETSGESADASGGRGRLAAAKGREGKGTEGKGIPPYPQKEFWGDFPDNLKAEKFQKVWAEWVKHRTEIRKPLKPTQITKQLKRLGSLGEAKAIAALNHTIANGWQGIREPEPDMSNAVNEKNNNTPSATLRQLEKETERLLK